MFQRGPRRDRQRGGRARNRGAFEKVGATARGNIDGRTASGDTRASTLTTRHDTRHSRLATFTTTARTATSRTHRVHACQALSHRVAAICTLRACVFPAQRVPFASPARSADRIVCAVVRPRDGFCAARVDSSPPGAAEAGEFCRRVAALAHRSATVFVFRVGGAIDCASCPPAPHSSFDDPLHAFPPQSDFSVYRLEGQGVALVTAPVLHCASSCGA